MHFRNIIDRQSTGIATQQYPRRIGQCSQDLATLVRSLEHDIVVTQCTWSENMRA